MSVKVIILTIINMSTRHLCENAHELSSAAGGEPGLAESGSGGRKGRKQAGNRPETWGISAVGGWEGCRT